MWHQSGNYPPETVKFSHWNILSCIFKNCIHIEIDRVSNQRIDRQILQPHSIYIQSLASVVPTALAARPGVCPMAFVNTTRLVRAQEQLRQLHMRSVSIPCPVKSLNERDKCFLHHLKIRSRQTWTQPEPYPSVYATPSVCPETTFPEPWTFLTHLSLSNKRFTTRSCDKLTN